MRILLIEDDKTVSQNIVLILKYESMVTDCAFTGEDALEAVKTTSYDLIILDLGLPDMDGYDVLKKMRMIGITAPILILSGLATPDKKIQGLGFGADDYLTKPFDRGELVARVGALVRRAKGHADALIRTGALVLNLNTKVVTIKGQPVSLTSKEYTILELLALKKGTTISKEQFLNYLYGGLDEPEMKIIDVFLCKIRHKLENLGGQEYIQTVWGRGYVLKDMPVEE